MKSTFPVKVRFPMKVRSPGDDCRRARLLVHDLQNVQESRRFFVVVSITDPVDSFFLFSLHCVVCTIPELDVLPIVNRPCQTKFTC